MRALYSAVSSLRAHQVRMDVISNNIANLNTAGFKGGRVTFQDVLSQSIGGGSQVGLGVAVGQVNNDHKSGSLQFTGRATDLAVENAGFFVMNGSQGRTFTRVGNFDWDSAGYLVNSTTGQRVQGWQAAIDGSFSTRDASNLADVKIPITDAALAQASTTAKFSRNLDAGAANGAVYNTSVTMYDSLGRPQTVGMKFTKSTATQWTVQYDNAGVWTALTTLTFGTDGKVSAGGTGTISLAPAGAAALAVAADFSAVTQSYSAGTGSDAAATEVDGQPYGNMQSVNILSDGTVMGRYSNGTEKALAQLAVASFPNPAALQKVGANTYGATDAAGQLDVGAPGSGGRSRLSPGNLEMSNVDLSGEFTDLILTQRGFQANTRMLTAADEMLQDVVNLRR